MDSAIVDAEFQILILNCSGIERKKTAMQLHHLQWRKHLNLIQYKFQFFGLGRYSRVCI